MASEFIEEEKLSGFEMLGVIGNGKFSTVHRARHKASDVMCALKKVLIFDIGDKSDRSEALREAYLLKSLDHPSVIKCHDAWLQDNELHIALELAEFGDLSEVLQRHKSGNALIPEGTVWNYLAQITCAVAHLKSKKIMHRDIKPANVFLDKTGRLKLGDLGLGRSFASRTLEQAKSAVGTPFYMSPECMLALSYSYPSDIWSLGCLTYELCALKSPFCEAGQNLYTLGKAVQTGLYPPLADVYSQELQRLIARMLNLDPANRPDVEEVLDVAVAQAAKFGNPVAV